MFEIERHAAREGLAQLFGYLELIAQSQPDLFHGLPRIDRLVCRQATTGSQIVCANQMVGPKIPEGLDGPGLELGESHLPLLRLGRRRAVGILADGPLPVRSLLFGLRLLMRRCGRLGLTLPQLTGSTCALAEFAALRLHRGTNLLESTVASHLRRGLLNLEHASLHGILC